MMPSDLEDAVQVVLDQLSNEVDEATVREHLEADGWTPSDAQVRDVLKGVLHNLTGLSSPPRQEG